MATVVYLATCSFLLTIQFIDGARILGVFPTPSISHQVVFRPLMRELAKRGHEVTVITTDPAYPKGGVPPNLTEIDVHDISYEIWQQKFIESTSKGTKDALTAQLEAILGSMLYIVEAQIKDKNVQNMINDKTKQFDLLILEAYCRPTLVFSHIYKVPVILMSSFGAVLDNYPTFGVPSHPFLYPAMPRQNLYDLSLWDKINELYAYYKLEKLSLDFHVPENAMLRRLFGPNVPPVAELNNNAHLLFLNIHPVFEGIRPVPPSVVYIGGLHQIPQKELPKDLKSFLDSSKNGVIYISFGTNVDPTMLPADRIEVLVKTLSQMPYDVLWKWNGDELPGRTENIRISKWLPQSDLLRHPKIKLFITQGGLQSTDEAITAGVPLVGVPMLGDQWYNVEKYKYLKIGVGVDMETLTVERFTKAINNVIKDDSYRKNVEKLRSIMRDEVQSPLERAVWWTEYVLRHGGARHLRDPAANISWYQYLELELVTIVIAVLFSILALFVIIIRFLFKKIVRVSVKIKSS